MAKRGSSASSGRPIAWEGCRISRPKARDLRKDHGRILLLEILIRDVKPPKGRFTVIGEENVRLRKKPVEDGISLLCLQIHRDEFLPGVVDVKDRVLVMAEAGGTVTDAREPPGVACGHPNDAPGPRITMFAMRELERRGGRYALVMTCCGGGQGVATIIENLRR